ncbi:MAG: nucleotide exchange factor GrpE, partial [Treponema sp.]|nr:nucleotide exchange factor GrpE [Treponema sp.]
LSDTIDDFYHFAAGDPGSPLFEQARMMRDGARAAADAAGIGIIDPCREPFDFRLHATELAEREQNMPNGHVVRTLKCGYTYKEEVVRRAAVVVNRIDPPNGQGLGTGGLADKIAYLEEDGE